MVFLIFRAVYFFIYKPRRLEPSYAIANLLITIVAEICYISTHIYLLLMGFRMIKLLNNASKKSAIGVTCSYGFPLLLTFSVLDMLNYVWITARVIILYRLASDENFECSQMLKNFLTLL